VRVQSGMLQEKKTGEDENGRYESTTSMNLRKDRYIVRKREGDTALVHPVCLLREGVTRNAGYGRRERCRERGAPWSINRKKGKCEEKKEGSDTDRSPTTRGRESENL